MPRRPRRIRPALLRTAATLACAIAAAAGASSGDAASTSTVVTMDVTSATTLDTTACVPGSSALAFGTVLPGTGAVTAACAVRFGSSNDTAALRVGQVDRRGAAMVRPFHGPVDTGFASAGTYSLNPSGGDDRFWSAAELPDGDILLGGYYQLGGSDTGTLLVRLNPDGTGHAGFGSGGVAMINTYVGGDDSPSWTLEALPDGTAIIGTANPSGASAMARVLADGTLDLTWAGGATFATLPGGHVPRNIRRTPSGQLLVQGTRWPAPVSCVVSRYSAGGVLDASYGSGGSTALRGSADSYCDGMDVDARGRAVVVGSVNFDSSLIVRLTANGQVDGSFGGGLREYDPSGHTYSELFDVDVRPDGGIVVTGAAGPGLLVEQYDRAGVLDPTFAGGSVSLAGQAWGGREVRWMDGRVVVVGDYGNGRILRLRADGAPDPAFSDDGFDDPAVPGSTNDNGLLLLGDGRALLYGSDGSVAQARTYAAASVPQHADGTADWNDGTGFFGACLASVPGGTATWTTGACAQSDGAWWNDVAAIPETVATAPSGNDSIIASLRFGVRVPNAQSPGAYVAPVALEVVAPAA